MKKDVHNTRRAKPPVSAILSSRDAEVPAKLGRPLSNSWIHNLQDTAGSTRTKKTPNKSRPRQTPTFESRLGARAFQRTEQPLPD